MKDDGLSATLVINFDWSLISVSAAAYELIYVGPVS